MTARFNFRATRFLLLRTTIRCPHCRLATRVQALALPAGHGARSEPGASENPCWQPVPLPAVLAAIEHLDPDTAQALAARHAQLQPPPAAERGWRNRCEHCRSPIGESVLHAEPGAAFMPRSAGEAAALRLEQVDRPVRAAAAEVSLDPPWLQEMLRG